MIVVKVTVNFITEFYRAFNSAQDGLSLKDSNGEEQLESSTQIYHLAIVSFTDFTKKVQLYTFDCHFFNRKKC